MNKSKWGRLNRAQRRGMQGCGEAGRQVICVRNNHHAKTAMQQPYPGGAPKRRARDERSAYSAICTHAHDSFQPASCSKHKQISFNANYKYILLPLLY